MGEYAEMMLDGTCDPETGEFNFDGEDGPGWPMTSAEAAEYSGLVGGRHRRPTVTGKPIHGFWRTVAEAVASGATDEDMVAARIEAPLPDVKRAVFSMLRAGYLHKDSGPIAITKRCRKELVGASA